jgi:hypothetical protein
VYPFSIMVSIHQMSMYKTDKITAKKVRVC